MEKLIQQLHDGDYSCVIRNEDDIRTFTQRGVADLYNLLKNDTDFIRGASIADKVVGKGAAALMILGGIKEIYTDVISLSALELLCEAKIEVGYVLLVPFIENRDKTNWCPLEKICYEEDKAENILPLIEGFINKIRLFAISLFNKHLTNLKSRMGNDLKTSETLWSALIFHCFK